jgi:hypothetical protein
MVVNPLPVALSHFQRELLQTLDPESLPRYAVASFAGEGHRTAAARVRSLVRYLAFVRRVRRQRCAILVLWPLLGWLDVLVWGLLARNRTYVLVHDPTPLRRQVGSGRSARMLVRRLTRLLGRAEIVTLSQAASSEVKEALPRLPVHVLPHPILRPADGRPRTGRDVGTVLVLGQYKPARDLALLEQLGPALADAGLVGKICGRGWPATQGWEVDDRFLSEDEFDSVLSHASVLLLPYATYFQSGVAVRAVELGTPVVGRRTGFLEGLLGETSVGIVDGDSTEVWLQHIAAAAAQDPEELNLEIWERTAHQWQHFARVGLEHVG